MTHSVPLVAALPSTIGALRRAAAATLPHHESAQLDVDLLLAEVLDCTRAQLLAWPARELDAVAHDRFDALLQRRAAREPIAYLLGHRAFYGLDLAVSPAVLIPRPDTETLVDAVLAQCDTRAMRVLELGTGSGAIALALAEHRGDWQIVATDRSAAALTVALDNALRIEAVQLRLVQADWCSGFARSSFDLIVSNPPYVGEHDAVDAELQFEPALALYAGVDGLDAIRRIVADAPALLHAGGWLFLEHGASQAEAVRTLMQERGLIAVRTIADLAGHERVTCGRAP